MVDADFVHMDYTDAIEILQNCGKQFEYPVEWGVDLQSEHERYLAEEHVGAPIILKNYPRDIKAFYMRQNDDGKTVAAMDVLAPGIGEIIGGSAREERLDVLDKRIEEMSLPAEESWFLPRLTPLRRCPSRWFWAWFRTSGRLRNGDAEHSRRDSVPGTKICAVLIVIDTINHSKSRQLPAFFMGP